MRKKMSVILCLVLVIVLSGCSIGKKQSDAETYVYYVSISEHILEGTEYAPEETETEKVIEELLDALKNPEDVKQYQSVFPQKIEVTKYEMRDHQLKLYFNSEYLHMKKSDEVLLRAAVVQTMVQVNGVEFVSFYVGEEPLRDGSGNAIGLMNANDFVQGAETSVNAYQITDLNLYFSDRDGTALVAEQRTGVRYSSNVSIEKLVVDQLMKGPQSNDAMATIPKKTTLLGVSSRDGICYVNFDSGFLTESFNQTPEVTIYSIVNSILMNSTANQVQISIDGTSDMIFRGTVDLGHPLQMNNTLTEE